jgi:hypothetical protein
VRTVKEEISACMLFRTKALNKAWLILIGWEEGTFKLERHLSSAFVLPEVAFSTFVGFAEAGSFSPGLVNISATA